jgi:hypothetical protein
MLTAERVGVLVGVLVAALVGVLVGVFVGVLVGVPVGGVRDLARPPVDDSGQCAPPGVPLSEPG